VHDVHWIAAQSKDEAAAAAAKTSNRYCKKLQTEMKSVRECVYAEVIKKFNVDENGC